MIIKVCGLREEGNIRDVENLGADLIGFDFRPGSERYVEMVSSNTGIMPDYSAERFNGGDCQGKENENEVCTDGRISYSNASEQRTMKRSGTFADDMPQNIITRIYNYHLDYVQLNGNESGTMIDNLRRTIDPDIRKGLKIIKTISIEKESDMDKWHEYKGHADLLLFDMKHTADGDYGGCTGWDMIEAYSGDIPFIIGGIGMDDAHRMRGIKNPMLAGVNLDEAFEVSPGMKDTERLKRFIKELEKK